MPRSTDSFEKPAVLQMAEDVRCARDAMEASDSDITRRAYVRALFAANEAQRDLLRDDTLRAHHRLILAGRPFDPWTLAMLAPAHKSIGNDGRLTDGPPRVRYLAYTAFLIRAAADAYGLDPSSWFGDHRYGEFREAVTIRNRLVHPKESDDLLVNIDHLQTIKDADNWWQHVRIQLCMWDTWFHESEIDSTQPLRIRWRNSEDFTEVDTSVRIEDTERDQGQACDR